MNPVVNFKLHVCLDSNIFLDEIESFIVEKGLSVFILIPVMLGLKDI